MAVRLRTMGMRVVMAVAGGSGHGKMLYYNITNVHLGW
jgi:hypothetical protein